MSAPIVKKCFPLYLRRLFRDLGSVHLLLEDLSHSLRLRCSIMNSFIVHLEKIDRLLKVFPLLWQAAAHVLALQLGHLVSFLVAGSGGYSGYS